MNKLGGLASKMPRTTLSWLIGVGSMMGIPLMSGFRQQVDALRRGVAGRLGRARHGGVGGKPGHGVSRRQGDQRGLSRTADGEHQGCARISANDGVGHGISRRGQRGSGRSAAVGRQLFPQPDSPGARHWRGRARHVARPLGRCGQLLFDGRPGAGARLTRRWRSDLSRRLRRAAGCIFRRGDGRSGRRNLHRRRAAERSGTTHGRRFF
jgi:hypothetical protein